MNAYQLVVHVTSHSQATQLCGCGLISQVLEITITIVEVKNNKSESVLCFSVVPLLMDGTCSICLFCILWPPEHEQHIL